MAVDDESLIAEYEQEHTPKRQCKVCESEYCGVIEELLLRGAGADSVSAFLARKGFDVGGTTIKRHFKQHVA